MEPLPATKPRHADVARDLMDGIASGRFAVGSLLPTELALCKRYSPSRHTVRVALAELAQRGLVSRRKNVGTRVESATPARLSGRRWPRSRTWCSSARRTCAPCASRAGALVWRWRGTGLRPRRTLAAYFQPAPRRRRRRPTIGWTDVYVDAAYADIEAAVRASPAILVSELIEQRHGRRIQKIRQDIVAVDDAGARARALQVEAGSPALKVTRRYFDADDEAVRGLDHAPSGRPVSGVHAAGALGVLSAIAARWPAQRAADGAGSGSPRSRITSRSTSGWSVMRPSTPSRSGAPCRRARSRSRAPPASPSAWASSPRRRP